MGYLDWLGIRSASEKAHKDQQNMQVKADKLNDALLEFVGGSNTPMLNPESDRENVYKGYMTNPDVYSIVNLITNAMRSIDWAVYEVKDQKKFRKYNRLPSEAKQHRLDSVMRLKNDSLEEVTDHSNKLVNLLDKPNPLQGWGEWIENLMGFKLITGNTYIHGVILEKGANQGLVNEMWVMPSHYMRIKASAGLENVVQGYSLEIGSSTVHFSQEEVMHMKYWSPDYEGSGSHLYGMSPLRAGARVVRQSNDAYTANAALLENAGAMGILSVNPDTMTQEQALELERKYYKKYGGAHKRGKIIITGATMDWKQIGMNAVDLNIIESQKMSLRDLCNIYQINSALLNDPDNKVYNNVREARKALYYEKVLPEMDTFRDEINRWLTARYNEKTGKQYYIDYDLESVPALQSDMKAVMEQVKDAWWITANEKREAMGYDTDPMMDQYFIPTSLVPMGQTTQEDEKDIQAYAVKRTFNDYPQSAVNIAKRAIEFTEKNPNDCATRVGKLRAQQISSKESLTYETVQRTFSFLSRAKTYDTGSFTDQDGNPVCGSISYAYWGGDPMRRWCKKVIDEVEGNADSKA